MRLIIGGAYQGQTELAVGKYPGKKITDGKTASFEQMCGSEILLDFHEAVRRFPDSDWESVFEKNPCMVVTANEIGCGIIPIEKGERLWRERCGRLCCRIAELSDEVIRVTAGIGVRIK